MATAEKELVLPPVVFAYVQDNTKSLSNTDTLLVNDPTQKMNDLPRKMIPAKLAALKRKKYLAWLKAEY